MIRIVTLSLALLVSVSYGQTSACWGLTPMNDPAVCAAGIGDECCRCEPVTSIHCEGCGPAPCPTASPTKSPTDDPSQSPTKRPTPQPTDDPSKSPSKSPSKITVTPKPTDKPTEKPTPKPVTTTVPPTTTTVCTCPPVEICTPSPLTSTKKSGKKNKAIGCGVGECDCDKGVVELRFKYKGPYDGVQIKIFYDKDSKYTICEFNNVRRGEQITCNLRGGPGLVKTGLFDFANETPFIITGPNGYNCAAQYHTSCSQDIVGVVQPECTDLVVSGWRDVGNVDGDDGGDCDDGVADDCDCDDHPTITTTTSNPVLIPIKIGDFCYCDTTGGSTGSAPAPPTPQPTEQCKKKKGKKGGCKSKGKKGSKKKGKKKGDGLGIGDCDCEGGQTELTMMYSGTKTVNIDFFHKDGTKICTVNNVKQGGEAVCNVLNYNNGVYSKLGTNTFLTLNAASGGGEHCQMSVHTSCSRDIVGTYGNDGHSCGTQMIVSGWKDANNEVSGGECDDGLTLCNCDSGVIVPEDNPLLNTGDKVTVEILPDICFCSSEYTESDLIDPTLSTGDKKVSHGIGKCECKNGIHLLRMIYLPKDLTNSPVNIELSRVPGEVLCTFDNVAAGTEIECDVKNPQTNWNRFGGKTYVKLTSIGTGEVCEGEWPTSCSNDVVGWSAGNCQDIIITGWSDNENDEECDDGFYQCECKDCTPYSTQGGLDSECAKTDGCYFNEKTLECETIAVNLWTGSNANTITTTVAVITTAIAALLY